MKYITNGCEVISIHSLIVKKFMCVKSLARVLRSKVLVSSHLSFFFVGEAFTEVSFYSKILLLLILIMLVNVR